MPATHPQSWQSGRWWGRRDEMVSCEAVVHEHGHPMCVNIVRGCPVVYCVVITCDRVLKTMCEGAMSRPRHSRESARVARVARPRSFALKRSNTRTIRSQHCTAEARALIGGPSAPGEWELRGEPTMSVP